MDRDPVLDRVFIGLLTGKHSSCETPVEIAVALRFNQIRSTLKPQTDCRCYDGNRCLPEQQGWRFIQSYGERPVEEIAAGKWDAIIEKNWHDCADAEYYYRYEKDWGN